tara:strand:- start:29944 stop:30045 length:102 start_codon:yes stop_codon:yes gene_type:complete
MRNGFVNFIVPLAIILGFLIAAQSVDFNLMGPM